MFLEANVRDFSLTYLNVYIHYCCLFVFIYMYSFSSVGVFLFTIFFHASVCCYIQ